MVRNTPRILRNQANVKQKEEISGNKKVYYKMPILSIHIKGILINLPLPLNGKRRMVAFSFFDWGGWGGKIGNGKRNFQKKSFHKLKISVKYTYPYSSKKR